MDNKKAAPTEANATQAHIADSTPLRLCPRQERVARALLNATPEGWVSREQIDRVAGASNGPDVILALRRKGIGIFSKRFERVDRDGRPCRPGHYRLTPQGAELLAKHRFTN